MPPLLVLAPIEPCLTGNGLAMRVSRFVGGAAGVFDVTVAVIPVAGSLPRCPENVKVPVVMVPLPERSVAGRRFAELLADPTWRRLLADASPMPPAAQVASPALAADVIAASNAEPGTPVHVVRSYMAPLGLAVAERLTSPWASLDLDDDDEALAAAQGETESALAYHRLVATFGPRFSAVSLASPVEAVAVERRYGLRTVVVPNAVAIRRGKRRDRPKSEVVLFVGNLGYRPNAEAATLLVEEILPAVRARLDRPVRVVLVGSYPPDGAISGLESHPWVTVAGFVDDLSDSYASASVVVAPFISGGGTRIKLLEAFAHRVPVVTTAVGAAGLAVRNAEHLLVAESVEDLATATVAVLQSPALADTLTTAALEFVRVNHEVAAVSGEVRKFFALAEGTHGIT